MGKHRPTFHSLKDGDPVLVQYFWHKPDGVLEVLTEGPGTVTKVSTRGIVVACPRMSIKGHAGVPLVIPEGSTTFSRITGWAWGAEDYGFRLHPKHAQVPPEEDP
jgi:hypothetical protein